MHQRARQLRVAHPRWLIWRSDAGRWWARDADITWSQIWAGCLATLDADTLDQLGFLLGEQDLQRARLTPTPTTAERTPSLLG